MANLNITELSIAGRDSAHNSLPIVQMPAVTTQNLAISAGTNQSAAFSARTGMIRVRTDTACAVLIGTNPTALTTSMQMDANSTEYFAVPVGQSYKIAVIAI
jgi:hypothetical protein